MHHYYVLWKYYQNEAWKTSVRKIHLFLHAIRFRSIGD